MKFLFQNMVEKNEKLGKNSIPIFFSLKIKVNIFLDSILIFQNDHLFRTHLFFK
jgi:hypothetical protein